MSTTKQKRLFSILLAICMLVSLLPAGMLSASAADLGINAETVYLAVGDSFEFSTDTPASSWSVSNTDVLEVTEDGTVTALAAGTASVTAQDEEGNVGATAYVAVTDKINFTYRFDKAYIGKVAAAPDNRTTNDWYPLDEVTYANTLPGHPDEIDSYSTIASDPWEFNSIENWHYSTIHGASAAYGETWGRGYAIWGKPEGGSNCAGSVSIKIQLPLDGNFIPSVVNSKGNSYGVVNYYLAPSDAENPTADEYLLGKVNLSGSGINNVDAFSARDLEAGEYIVTAKCSEAYPNGLNLMIWTAFNLNNTDITSFEDDVVFLAPGETTTVVATAPTSAADPTIVYESSNDDVVTVDEDGLVTAIGVGSAEIYATSTVGDTATAYVTITDKTKFSYRFDKAWLSATASDWKKFETVTYGNTTKGHPDEIASYPGNPTDPWAYGSLEGWYIDGTVSAAASAYSVWSKPDADGATQADGHFAIKIKVPADGNYTPSITYSKGSGWGRGDFYIAPVDAEDPISDDYRLGDVDFQAKPAVYNLEHEFAPINLEAGEYIVTATHCKAEGVSKLILMGWAEFALEDKTAISVAFDQPALAMTPGDVEVLSATVLPETTEDKSVTYTSSNEDVALVIDDAVYAMSEGTATITATSNADPTKTATILVYVGNKNFHYNYMKFAGFGVEANDAAYLADHANDFKYTTSGSASEVGTAYPSFGWKVGSANSNTAKNWVWSASAVTLGPYFAARAGGYASMNIYVPAAGTYSVSSIHSDWTGGGTVDMFLAPVDAEDPFAEDYQLATISHLTETGVNHEEEELLGEVTIDVPGEYQVIYRSVDAKGYFVKGLKLIDATQEILAESLTLSATGTVILAKDATLTVTPTILPAAATNKNLTWESSDDSIATVEDGVVTAIGKGFATITATTTDGSNLSKSFTVMAGYEKKYSYKVKESLAPLYSVGNDVSVTETDAAKGYGYAINAGSDPWMYDSSDMGSGKEYCSYTASTNAGFGVFVVNGNENSWSRLKINVAEAGTYMAMFNVSDWNAANDFDVYIAPTWAADPVAEDYKVLTWTSSLPSSRIDRSDKSIDMDLVAGDYYVTFVSTKRNNGGALIALFGIDLYKSAELSESVASIAVSTEDGAQIRTTGKQGLRFISTIDKTSADYGKVVEFGTILLPTADLNADGTNLTIGYENNNHKVVKVPATKWYAEDENTITYTAVLTSIKEANYTRAYSARAYAIYENANGDLRVVYGDVIPSRSVYQVATNGLASETATAEEKELFQAIIDIVNAL